MITDGGRLPRTAPLYGGANRNTVGDPAMSSTQKEDGLPDMTILLVAFLVRDDTAPGP
jgi:hypothetical protein